MCGGTYLVYCVCVAACYVWLLSLEQSAPAHRSMFYAWANVSTISPRSGQEL